MSPSLPPEILDLIAGHLHDEPTTLGACCLVSESWIPRTRIHLFHRVEFCSSGFTLESWMRTSPDPSNSPAHYTRSLHLSHFKVIIAAISDALPWIDSFNHIVKSHLLRSTTRTIPHPQVLLYFLHPRPAPRISQFYLFLSSPKDLLLHYLVAEGMTEGWGAPPAPPKFTESCP